MDYDGIASHWAGAESLPSPTVLSALLDCDPQQLGALRISVSRHANLAHALDLIDVLTSFRQARQRLDEARLAAQRMADIAAQLVLGAAAVPSLALASVERAVHARAAATDALDKAVTGREKIQAAVVLELAEAAAVKAREAAVAADRLTEALAALVRASSPATGDQHLADHDAATPPGGQLQ